MTVKKKKISKAKRKFGVPAKLAADMTSTVATITMPAAMKLTGKSMGFLYRCINDGSLPAFKVARATVFRQSDIDKLMTPVPYKPVSERGWKRPAKAKETSPKVSRKSSRPKTVSGKARPVVAGKRPSRALKASVAKALSKMTTSTPESSAAGNG